MRDNLRMKSTLERTLARLLPEERVTRLGNLTLLMVGLFLARTVHLSQIVRAWPLPARLVSLENRLRRFLKNAAVCAVRTYRPVAQALLARFAQALLARFAQALLARFAQALLARFAQALLARFAQAPIRLILDVTQVGPEARMLSLSVAYRKRALPLAWRLYHGVKGNVPAKEACALLEQIRPLLPSGAEVWVLGDSSFGQAELITYLRRQGWHFVLRLGGHVKVERAPGLWHKLGRLGLAEGQTRDLGDVRLMEKHALADLYVLLHWQEGEEEPWYRVSDQPLGRRMLARYRPRMWTEALYGDLKGHGFDLQKTQLRDPRRIERLLLGVCWTYVYLLVLGAQVVKRGLRQLVDRKERRDKSYFRIGWDYVAHCLRLGHPLPPLRLNLYVEKVIGG